MPFTVLPLLLAALANATFFLPKLPESTDQVAAIPHMDKLVHVAIFALTTWAVGRLLVGRVLQGNPGADSPSLLARLRGAYVVTCVGLAVWACAIELIQSMLPLRSADPVDVAADAVGILVGLGVLTVEVRARRRRRQ